MPQISVNELLIINDTKHKEKKNFFLKRFSLSPPHSPSSPSSFPSPLGFLRKNERLNALITFCKKKNKLRENHKKKKFFFLRFKKNMGEIHYENVAPHHHSLPITCLYLLVSLPPFLPPKKKTKFSERNPTS